jgi:hypothetical protein
MNRHVNAHVDSVALSMHHVGDWHVGDSVYRTEGAPR